MGSRVNPEVVADWEEVARILFSPLFISEGVLSQRAFLLEQTSNETYISVLQFRREIEGQVTSSIIHHPSSLFHRSVRSV